MTKKHISAEEVARNRKEALAGMDAVFLQCREWMHAWQEISSYVSLKKGGQVREITEVVKCLRCATTRFDRLHVPSYELVGRRYTHPDGYLMPGSGFTRRAHVREEKFRRHEPVDMAMTAEDLAQLIEEGETHV